MDVGALESCAQLCVKVSSLGVEGCLEERADVLFYCLYESPERLCLVSGGTQLKHLCRGGLSNSPHSPVHVIGGHDSMYSIVHSGKL